MKILVIGGSGYVGSALVPELVRDMHKVDVCDIGWFGQIKHVENLLIQDYKVLNNLQAYNVVILLAGHSSVAMCNKDITSTINNNVRNFAGLLEKLTPDQKFIYISSASVYGNTGMSLVAEDRFKFSEPKNAYDASKQMIDNLAAISGLNYYSLRLGTVCGYSPNMRIELMINSMYGSFLRQGYFTVANRDSYRAVLAMEDLARAIKVLTVSTVKEPGVYNICSFNRSIGGIADVVEAHLDCPVKKLRDSETYSFAMDADKFESTFGFEFINSIGNILNDLKRVNREVWNDETKTRNMTMRYA